MNNNKTMTITKLLAAALLAAPLATFSAGCGKGSPLNAGALGDMIGGPAGQGLKAAGKAGEAAALSQRDEDNMGQGVGLTVISRYGLLRDEKLTRYVNLVGITVASASDNPGGNWVFGILDAPDVNAFAGPNGYVFITRGLLDQTQNEAELAGVLAHECAHVLNHDGLNYVRQQKLTQAGVELAKTSEEVARFGQLTDGAADVVVNKGYSRDQETKADLKALRLLKDAGYDPAAYVAFLKRVESRSGAGGVMSTHPGGPDRVAKAEAELAKVGRGGQTLADRFKRNVTVATSGAR